MRFVWLTAAGAVLVLGTACSENFGGTSTYAGGGDFGGLSATPGGSQNIGAARQTIENGGIPDADSIRMEALLSEHDLSAQGPVCEQLLCLRPNAGLTTTLEGEETTTVLLGMASGLADDVDRPDIDLVVVLDRTDSMSIDMAETNTAVIDLLGQLRPADGFAVVAYGNTIEQFEPMGPIGEKDIDELSSRIAGIAAVGMADGGAALVNGFQIAHQVAAAERLTRVVLLTCGYPAADSIRHVVTEGAQEGIGLSVVGVILGHDESLDQLLRETPGGNFFFAQDLALVETLFQDGLASFALPVAYDMTLSMGLAEGWLFDRLYGLPGHDSGEPEASMEIATAFLSRRGGGIVAQLSRTPEATNENLGEVKLDYVAEPAFGFDEAVADVADLGTMAASATPGVRKSAVLVEMGIHLRRAVTLWWNDEAEQARTVVDDLRALMDAEAEALDDDALRGEVGLLDQLLANMAGGQGG